MFAVSAALAAAQTSAPDNRWFGIFTADGTRIGHASREVTAAAGGGREIVERRSIRIQEEGQPPTLLSERTLTREDGAGRVTAISEHVQSGRVWSQTEATIRPGQAEITRRTLSTRWAGTVALPAGVRFDDGEGLLPGWDWARRPRLEFDAFSIGAMAVEHVVIEPTPTPDASGRRALVRRRYDNGQLRGVSRLLVAPAGEIVEIAQPMMGTTMSMRASDRETALRRPDAFSVLAASLVRAPYRMPASALNGHVRYRFAFRDGLNFPLPETGEQHGSAAGEAVSLDVCEGCGAGLPTDPLYLADARRATAWLQSDHPRLRAIAAPVARMQTSEARKMDILRVRARPYLATIDFTGHFSALDTLSRRAGDCTEAAVLLAALGRAAGIPTRVAAGLVYSREQYHGVSNVFMPHAWALAYVDGRWRSFDAALDAFDASHIALTIGDGDMRSVAAAMQLAGLLEWQGMTEVRRRPAQ
ncbi:MAG TPA: transglutaminase-like domain-containing protein [Allosphingosinicella sp.]|nr:transglutaminase-like domain-containing protein [Allosphingosinicella sp.]